MPSRSSKARKAAVRHSINLDDTTENDQHVRAQTEPTATDTAILPPPPPPLPISRPSPASRPTASIPPTNWPSSIPYLTHPVLSAYLPATHLKWLRTRPQPPDDLPVITFPLSQADIQTRVAIRVIDDNKHPAHGQRGLFAERDLKPDELVVVYLGYVHGSTVVERQEQEQQARRGGLTPTESKGSSDDNAAGDSDGDLGDELLGTWDTSSYDLNMYRSEDVEVAVDAGAMGNEGRFVNDYRGVPVQMQDRGKLDEGSNGKDRKAKRRVKGWEGEPHVPTKSDCNRDEVEDEGAREGDREHKSDAKSWQWNKSNSNGTFDVAMPNAEFRDVWFEIPGDIGLSLRSATSRQHSEPTREQDVNGTISSTLNNVHLDDPSPATGTGTATATSTVKLPKHDNENEHNKLPTQQRNPNGNISLSLPKPRRKRKTKMRGVAIFVMPAGKSGKRKNGIKKGQEVLVSYGKGFWAYHRVESKEG